ncbi:MULTISPECIES: UDP-glucose 4-epimerase GalE [unclassified Streptomyces]|uniref:UDP-glucose 4-epimerase GalE n=1 Tax=unclassified Streptomyces TaxID=2593676 RepID=UPI002254BB3F|nr:MULTISPECIES: UDP-glucose 4-epimerase GalE [unclassified Streptomyces]WSP58296.1 UDP-glucose 4-epimerase GalE [Streptomyces sp. NBC_01241]WSU21128.1 UDP-glucose 4-epimerase GalE [Streptomyces sp. NBC_01108]MCX4790046.1 UDP-glucose 4-epimerase GalE [Streptomyces sp. NBC_01221]MCX4794228.1 UDP-glucose 4-epimerase GalE [Streptomyces sp. NBC_01242]WSJ35620.1 UDP-glucose 4-epimerase GalE [Streptomyces sp. NBC_01321]
MTWLITGGAGFIGAHVVRAMLDVGEQVVVYDDLSTGDPNRVPEGVPFVKGSTLDRDALDRTLAEFGIDGVVHLAAKKQVAESVARPLHYYRENVHGLQNLLEAVTAAGARRFLFSSSAAVYGLPDVDLVSEDTPCAPINPYGETKLVGEWMVRAAGAAHGMATASLRYFNVAGAAGPQLADTGVFNLIPMVFEKLTEGRAPVIFGDDYATSDGTCVRDFIHVEDLASAHVTVARALGERGDGTDLTVNIGLGEGVSVREMISLIGEVTGYGPAAEPTVSARRPGDPARVVASAAHMREELGWTARHDVREMVAAAWEGWCLYHPEARR